ncbi:MAG: DUF4250 domain-containing protein [Bacteroidales bacterium]|nr:DUF4250 domain-containing protein [Bacteroidales bacterium]
MIPQNPDMLLSFINMKLRDEFDSFSELCDVLDLDRNEIEQKLANAGYVYNEQLNQFK